MRPEDNLTIDTPEQIALELPLAGIGSRSLAIIVDSLLQIMIAAIIIIIALSIFFSMPSQNVGLVGVAIVIFVLFCLYWGYFAFFEIIWNGQTPGKRLMKIRVIKESGRQITPLEAIGRNLLRAVDILPSFYGIGLLCMMLNKQNKRLGDFLAGTVVVYEKKGEGASPALTAGPGAANTDLKSVRIAPEELVVLETYLKRRFELDPNVRIRTARQITAMIKAKTGVESAEGESNDHFIESVAKAARDAAGYR